MTDNPVTDVPYLFDYTLTPPLPMQHNVDGLPPGEGLITIERIAFVTQLIGRVLALTSNFASLVGSRPNDQATPGSEAVGSISERARDLHQRALGLWAKIHDDGMLGDLENFLEEMVSGFIAAVLEAIELGLTGELWGRATRPEQFFQQFRCVEIPSAAWSWMTDASFGRTFTQGPAPMNIRRVDITTVVELFGRPPEAFPAVSSTDGLSEAGHEGRLFLADYRVFDGLAAGTIPAEKFVYAPLVLLIAPASDAIPQPLLPVAIAVEPNNPDGLVAMRPEPGAPAAECARWQCAKIVARVADENLHVTYHHYLLCHELMEVVTVVTHVILSDGHPVKTLLLPHFEGTLAINDQGVSTLMSSDGLWALLLAGELSDTMALLGRLWSELDFESLALPRDLAARGVDDVKALADYPYRDDGLLLWAAIERWVTSYVELTYTDDDAVASDAELADWVARLQAPMDDECQGGGLHHIGDDGTITTRATLGRVLTIIVWVASARHSCVHFPMFDQVNATPLAPMSGAYPVPTPGSHPDPVDYLPSLEGALLQQVLGDLAGVWFTRLGHGPEGTFTDPAILDALAMFQLDLARAAEVISARNAERVVPYPYLLPSRIPMSVNV